MCKLFDTKCIKISQKMSKKMILWYIIDIH
nr:MAG TPA: hypothetical protein [Bacteriophage sp.]